MEIFKERLMSKVKANPVTSCWEWTAALNSNGYGVFRIGGRKDGVMRRAHRIVYELFKGPISGDLQLDHLCRVRHCVNPDHLEPVTQRENTLRGVGVTSVNAAKTHCCNGHEFTPENTIVRKNESRMCRTCDRIRKQAYRRACKEANK